MKPWKNLTVAERADAFREAYPIGKGTARSLAEAIGRRYSGVTKNVIIDFYRMHGDLLVGFALQDNPRGIELCTPAPVSHSRGEPRCGVIGWPPLKKAIWDEVIATNLNDGKYISAWELTDRLYAAALASTAAEGSQP